LGFFADLRLRLVCFGALPADPIRLTPAVCDCPFCFKDSFVLSEYLRVADRRI
jgi:hypothetical protein